MNGGDLPDAAVAVLRRNRGIQAALDIRKCKEEELDLSNRDMGNEGLAEVVQELKVYNHLYPSGFSVYLLDRRHCVLSLLC